MKVTKIYNIPRTFIDFIYPKYKIYNIKNIKKLIK